MKLFVKVRVYYKMRDQDKDSVTFFYSQLVYEIVNGRYLLNKEKAIQLAANQLQVEKGNYNGDDHKLET